MRLIVIMSTSGSGGESLEIAGKNPCENIFNGIKVRSGQFLKLHKKRDVHPANCWQIVRY